MARKLIISATVKRTYNMGDFENICPQFTVTEEFTAGVKFTDKGIVERQKELRGMVMNEIKEFYKEYVK